MRALRLTDKDTGPTIVEIPKPSFDATHAVIRLSASALNRRDVWIKRGQYPGIRYPITLGSDGCGTVEATSAQNVHWVGRRVVLYPGFNWGPNPRVQSDAYRILGLPDDGTFADYIRMPIDSLFAAPQHLNDQEAAALPLAGLTAWRAVKTKGCIQHGMKVLITGIGGGVAQMAALFSFHHGARITVTSSDSSKLDRATFAHHGVRYTDENWWRQLQGVEPGGYDVIIDSAGGSGFGHLVRLLAPGGRLVFFGGTQGKWPEILPQHLFYKQVEILATTMGSPDEFNDMIQYVGEHTLHPPVAQCFPLADGAAAFDYLEGGQQYGKVVLTH